ncbi:ATP-binding protein [Croceitalea sp. MTPC5]|uniref:ATP-binding protein n=1 Tax=Croceitalea sp. MTPC5 TaxID=3056565 RepID=UPI0030D5139A
MKIRTSLFLFLLCIIKQGYCFRYPSQHSNITSDSIQIWIKWAKDSVGLDRNERLIIFNKAIEEAKTKNSKVLSDISFAALETKDSILFKKINKKVIKISNKVGAKKSHGLAHWDSGDFYKDNQPDSAFYHYQEAYKIFTSIELDSASLHYPGGLLLAIGDLKDDSKDHIGAERDVIRAIQYFTKVERRDWLFGAYNSLGVVQNGLKKFDKGLEYHHKAKDFIQYAPKGRHFGYQTTNANNIASTYLRKGNFEKAFELYIHLEKTEGLRYKRPKLYAKVLGSRAYSGFMSGLNDYQALEKSFVQSNKMLDSIGYIYDKARNYEYHARVLAAKKDTSAAIQKALLARKIAEETKNNDRLLSSLQLLTTLDKRNSATYARSYFDLSETLQLQERSIQDKFARIRMETDEIIEENETLSRQKQLYGGIALGLLVFGIGVFTIISQRISNQRLKFKQKQQESNQEIYNLMLSQQGKIEEGKKSEQKRVSEELHDGILGQMLGIRLILSGLNDRTDEAAVLQRGELIEKLRELEEEIRTISHELNAAAYEKVDNFTSAIKELIQNISDSAAVRITFEYDKALNWDQLKGDFKINLYRIIQECIQNCVKHAKCENIVVNFFNKEKMLHLTISDDGIGFNTAKGKKGIGLRNITSRVKKLHGQLKIDSKNNIGTVVTIDLPMVFALDGSLKQEELHETIQAV